MPQVFVTPLAKSSIDETSDSFHGLYMGMVTPSANAKYDVETSDLTIHVGRFPSDTNTGAFSQKLAPTVIGLHPDYVFVGQTRWEGVSFVPVLQKLVRRLRARQLQPAQTQWCKSVSFVPSAR